MWPIALIRALKNWRNARDNEVEWDARGDSLVMARPMAAPAVATALMVIAASTVILLSGWRRDYVSIWPYALTWSAALHSQASKSSPPQPIDPGVFAVATPATPASEAPPAPPPAPVTQAVVAPPLPAAAPAIPAVSAAQTNATEAQMSQQVSAAQARRLRIDGYEQQAASAQRGGSFASLQGSCKRWTIDQPGSASAWRCLGLAQFQSGAGREALPALRQSLKLGSKDPQVEDAILRILRP